MSLYRFVRMTALLALARRYRGRLFRLLFALCFALVTAWQYADVAEFVGAHYPDWAGWALALKTLIVYAALFLVFWELRGMLSGDAGAADAAPAAASRPAGPAGPARGPLDELAERPHLRSRREDILRERRRPAD